MSIHRKAAKRDANEPEIEQALEKAGACFTELSGEGIPDLLIGYHGYTLLAEVKSKKGKLTPAQDKFHMDWKGGKIWILRSIDDVFEMLKDYQS